MDVKLCERQVEGQKSVPLVFHIPYPRLWPQGPLVLGVLPPPPPLALSV